MRAAHRAATLAALGAFLVVANASAYCRTRNCDPSRDSNCRDDGVCVVGGLTLEWPTSCIGFTVQENGSERHGITATTLERLTSEAFGRWQAADCGGGTHPEISIESLGRVSCDRAEYNQDYGNANIFMFREDDWEAMDAGHALALTTLWFNPQTGVIFDADVEINGTTDRITIGQVQDGVDLPSILTHEIGHFLGLSHSGDPRAVMRPFYEPGRDNLRVLHADDIAGICSIFTPGRTVSTNSCTPRHGFASDCRKEDDSGCSVSAAGAPSPASTATPLAALGLGLVLARRSRRRARGS